MLKMENRYLVFFEPFENKWPDDGQMPIIPLMLLCVPFR